MRKMFGFAMLLLFSVAFSEESVSEKSDSLGGDSAAVASDSSLGERLDSAENASAAENNENDLSENGQITELENVKLQKIVEITIATEPSEAAVVFNDSVIGLSPVKVSNVLVGKHSLVLKKKGCYMRKISLQIDSSVSFNFTLNRPGSVCFTSEPQGAQIFVNDKAAKKTPFVDSIVKPGEYIVRAELDGYGVSERKITVLSGADDTLKFALEPSSKPDTAKVVQREIDPKKQKKVRTIVIASIFAVFGVILILMESLGEK